jgi:hypothetical protein
VKQGASGDVFLKFPQLGSGLASCAIYIFALRALVLEWTLSACVVDGLGVGGDVTLDAAAVPVMVYVSSMCTQDNTIDVSIFLPSVSGQLLFICMLCVVGNHTSFGPALQDFKAADIWGSERDSPWDDERMSWISFMKR